MGRKRMSHVRKVFLNQTFKARFVRDKKHELHSKTYTRAVLKKVPIFN